MKTTKKPILVIAALCLIASIALVACKGGKVTIVDFDDSTAECEYASVYTLDMSPAKDDKGNEYPVTAVVSDADGKRVAVFENKFDIMDIRGYVIKYTVVSGEKTLAERTVTISVKATIKPTVTFSAISEKNVYEIGVPFILPTYTVSSPLTDDISVSAKLVLKGATDEEIPTDKITNGKFTPEKAGNYEYTATADDGLGNTVTEKKEFAVRTAPDAGEVESFDVALSEHNVFSPNGELQNLRYGSQAVGGINGYAEMNTEEKYPALFVRPRQTINSSEYPYMSFKMYVKSDGLVGERKTVMTKFARDNDDGFIRCNYLAVPDKWTEIFLDTKLFYDNLNADGYGELFMFSNDGIEGEKYREQDEFVCYVADIKGVKTNTPKQDDALFDFTDESVFNQFNLGNRVVTGESVMPTKDFGFDFALTDSTIASRKAVVEVSTFNGLPKYPAVSVNPAYGKDHYAAKGYTHIRVPLLLDGESLEAGHTSKTAVVCQKTANASANLLADTWTDIEISLDDFFEAADDDGFIGMLVFVNESDNPASYDPEFKFYIGEIKAFEKEVEPVSEFELVADGGLSLSKGTNISGVIEPVKLIVPASYSILWVKPNKTIDEYKAQNKTHMRVRLYIDSATATGSAQNGYKDFDFFYANSGGVPSETQYVKKRLPFDKWVTLDFTLGEFFNHNYDVSEKGIQLFWIVNQDIQTIDNGLVVYMDEIQAVAPDETDIVSVYDQITYNSDFNNNMLGSFYTEGMTCAKNYGNAVGGAEDTVKLNVGTGGQDQIKIFLTLKNKESIKSLGYTHIKVRIYIDSSTLTEASKNTSGKNIMMLYGKGACEKIQNAELDKWVEFEWEIDSFYSALNDNNTVMLFTSYNFDYPDGGNPVYYDDNNFALYLDSIKAIKKTSA